MSRNTKHMKWSGWGDEKKSFCIGSKPALLPYIQKSVGITDNEKIFLPINPEKIPISEAVLNTKFLSIMTDHGITIKFDNHDRLLHAYGKSFRDVWRIRNGILTDVPDCVCYPQSEDDVVKIMRAAFTHNVIIIPFGGGTNIAGCLEARDRKNRMVVSLDMQHFSQVIKVDTDSMVATAQAGILGPALESALNKTGVTLGHFPDSFEYSSLGGWVATRSAGMQSDKYGKIEDMVVGLRLITPQGIIVTRQVPKSSNGIDIKHICIGSEGILGVITEVTVQVHPLPEKKMFYGYLFGDFDKGTEAIRQAVRMKCSPSMTRLNDPDKTSLSFAYKSTAGFLSSLFSKLMKYYLVYIKKMDLNNICLMLVAFEGTKKEVRLQKKKLDAIYAQFGGVPIGEGPGKSFEKGKYDFPYLRDFIMDRGVVADVSETSVLWTGLLPLYQKTRFAIQQALREENLQVWCGCHISHTYHSGASLYFTFAFLSLSDNTLPLYDKVKQAAENSFMENGATVSHHHAIGYEHLPWLEADISRQGIEAIVGIKKAIDPKNIMNPGKIVSGFFPT